MPPKKQPKKPKKQPERDKRDHDARFDWKPGDVTYTPPEKIPPTAGE